MKQILLDTNIIIRLADRDDPDHQTALMALNSLTNQQSECVLVPQVIYEYWVVATRPSEQNGLGLTSKEVGPIIDHWLDMFRLYRDERLIFHHWKSLVADYDVLGRQAHDARLVAAMQRHGLRELLTFNAQHFRRYSDIEVISPENLAA